MGLKKRSKVSAAFNMSSLTDIIFLLLIFFMLTSNLVSPNALNLKLPGKCNPTVTSTDIPEVYIAKNGNYSLNGRRIIPENLEPALQTLESNSSSKLNMTISPAKGVAVEHVVFVMDIAMRLKINTILATEK